MCNLNAKFGFYDSYMVLTILFTFGSEVKGLVGSEVKGLVG